MISVKDIQKIESEKRRVRKETYSEILKQFDKKIRYAVEVGDRQVFLSTPQMIFGFPMYNVESATAYLARQLRNLGYIVRQIDASNMYVTWDVKNKDGGGHCEEVPEEIAELPALINLKKVASKIRGERMF
jgi:hypothetical protein